MTASELTARAIVARGIGVNLDGPDRRVARLWAQLNARLMRSRNYWRLVAAAGWGMFLISFLLRWGRS